MYVPRFLLNQTTRRTALKGAVAAGALSTTLRSHLTFAQNSDSTPEADPTPATFSGPQTILIGGLDSRGISEPENSDVLMLCRVDLANKTLRVLNINRDLYLEIPGFGTDKITRAYDYGSKADNGKFKAGAELMKATIEHNFFQSVDSVVLTTFQGFRDIVDAFDGVTVNNPYEVADTQYPTEDYGVETIDFPAGEQELDGDNALKFCRTRHQDGDPGRVMRQQIVLRALLDEANEEDPGDKLWQLVKSHRKLVRTDLGPSRQLAYVLAVPEFTNDNIEFGNLLDYMSSGYAPNGAWIYQGDWTQIPDFVAGFLDGSIDVPQDVASS
jgi:polyisoprenyl-teichoic acid--peptidoglycan teichoic acid transferase